MEYAQTILKIAPENSVPECYQAEHETLPNRPFLVLCQWNAVKNERFLASVDIAPNHGFRGTGVHLAIFRFRGVRIHNNARCRPGPVSVPQETFCCLMELQHHQFGSDAGHVERRFGSFGTQKEYRDCARVSWVPYVIWHLPTLYNCFVVASTLAIVPLKLMFGERNVRAWKG